MLTYADDLRDNGREKQGNKESSNMTIRDSNEEQQGEAATGNEQEASTTDTQTLGVQVSGTTGEQLGGNEDPDDDASDEPPADEPEDDKPQQNRTRSNGGKGKPNQQPEVITIPRDAWQDRVAQAARQSPEFKKLQEQLAERDNRLRKIEEDQMSDHERAILNAQREVEQRIRQEEDQSRQEQARKYQRMLLEKEIKLAASAANFQDPNDALLLVNRQQIEYIEETGDVVGLEEEIKRVIQSKPYLVRRKRLVDTDAEHAGGSATTAAAQNADRDASRDERVRTNILGSLSPGIPKK